MPGQGQERHGGRVGSQAGGGRKPWSGVPWAGGCASTNFGGSCGRDGYRFEITRDPWKLYVGDAHYSSLGYYGFHDWEILQGRCILCLLFEYVATLGLVDVAYIQSVNARLDFTNLAWSDMLDFLSRHDGLENFRLNPLGAYCSWYLEGV